MSIQYRPEIDGLRAIAVGAVILYHAKINIFGQSFSGGFIGVDIFFVISGYLITSIILKELVNTGSFSFKFFYERRIRRILPVLLVVMLLSLPIAWLFLLPDNFVDFSKSILYSIGFSSNFYFHNVGQEYDAESGLFIPFLHTWSLSVEEQYYILFPIILFTTFKYFRKYLIHIFIICFIVSLGLASWSSKNFPSASFYFVHTRMWELLSGSILAYFEITRGYKSKNKILNLISPTLGLFLIVHSILFFNTKMFHPSFYTLSPIIGVCLIIWYSNKDELITKILSTKLFVGIGLISYSLYLWHYPFFSFARVTYFFNDNILKELSVGFIIIILSILSYYFVEKPFRNKNYKFRKLIVILLSLIIFLISFMFIILKKDGIPERVPNIFQFKLKNDNIDYNKKKDTQKIVLIGDSHAKALAYNLNEELKKKDFSLYFFQTLMYLKNFMHTKKKYNKEFLKNNENIDNFLENNSNLVVIFHHRWTRHLTHVYFDDKKNNKKLMDVDIKLISNLQRENNIRQGLTSQIKKIVSQGHDLILVYPVPEMDFIPERLLYRMHLFEKNFFDYSVPILSGSYDEFKKKHKLIFEIFDSIESPNIYRVYPHKLFCDNQIKNRCITNDKERIFYYDDDHLSIFGSKLVVDEIIKKIKNNEIN